MSNNETNNNETTPKWRHPAWFYVTTIIIFIMIAAVLVFVLLNKTTTTMVDSDITVENWFSFLVSLIGICTTLMVASQVLNFVEVRKYVSDADAKMKELKDFQSELLEDLANEREKNKQQKRKATNYLGNAFYVINEIMPEENLTQKTLCLVYSLTILDYPSNKVDVIQKRLDDIKSNLSKLDNLSEFWKKALKNQIDDINEIEVKDCTAEQQRRVIVLKSEIVSLLYKI